MFRRVAKVLLRREALLVIAWLGLAARRRVAAAIELAPAPGASLAPPPGAPPTHGRLARVLGAVADLAGRRRRLLVLAWIGIVVVAAPFAGRAQEVLSSGGFEVPGSSSRRIAAYLGSLPERGSQGYTFLAVGQSPDAVIDDALARARARHPELRLLPERQRAADGSAVAVYGLAAITQDEGLDLAQTLTDELERTDGATRVYVLGALADYDALQRVITADLRSAESLSLPVVLVVLLALFGAVVAALLPAALGLASVSVSLALVYVVARQTDVSVFATTMVSMIGIGVAVDYSMFILARFREELRGGAATATAVRTALETSGAAVVFSGVTVVVSLLSILLVPVRAIQSMAAAAALVTLVAVLASVTLLPALLHALGPRVDRLRIGRRRDDREGRFWHRFVEIVLRRPVVSFLLAGGLLVTLGLPAFDMESASRAREQLPQTAPVVVGNDELAARVTGPGRGREGALVTMIRGATPSAAELAALDDALAADPDVEHGAVERAGDATLLISPIAIDPDGDAAVRELVPRARAIVAGLPLASSAQVDVGGISAFNHDLDEQVGGDLVQVIAVTVLLAYVVLLVLLRSLLLPLKAVVMNVLSILAAYGIVVAIFQWGWLDGLGYESLGHINTFTPPLLFAITFGLSMDYEVFLLSRIRERYLEHGDNERAVAEGIAGSARLITSAALIMVLVFAGFALTGVATIKELGVGLAAAIAIDATIVRLVLVPATMRLLGRWNWWLPSPFARTLSRVEA